MEQSRPAHLRLVAGSGLLLVAAAAGLFLTTARPWSKRARISIWRGWDVGHTRLCGTTYIDYYQLGPILLSLSPREARP